MQFANRFQISVFLCMYYIRSLNKRALLTKPGISFLFNSHYSRYSYYILDNEIFV